ncbi:hypothetical protein [Polaromonas sp. A23]|uniref:hypothetical protein n=1 Tax=Polaromonas sp. A23 TaxID=1944133 RepID=UPI000984986F|nr:hypothetical protein [Polaromonas sp. A23]OOG43917.1 hypothetical protein B0B52_08390 [Polaromonas sp. A23]
MDILRSMAVLISQPWLALMPAALFAVCAMATKSRTVFVVAALWLLYGLYELAMKFRVLCSGECNIRIDLLVLYPLLLVATLVGLVTVVLAAVRRAQA